MKNKIVLPMAFFCCFFTITGKGQLLKEILDASSDSLGKIQIIQYTAEYQYTCGLQVNNLEAVVTAEGMMDTLFGMKFTVISDSIEHIYDGRNAFEINHREGEVRQLNPNILVKKGIPDLLMKEVFQGYEKESYSGLTSVSDNYDAITYDTRSENGITTKRILINRRTGIPERIESTVYNNGRKEVLHLTLSNIVINRKQIPRVDTRIIAYLDKYILLPIGDIGVTPPRDSRDSLVGKIAPDFVLKSFGDKSIQLSDLKGKLVLLDFWEVWCGPCRMSMPHLQKLNDNYRDRGLVILGITQDNMMAARGLVSNRKITYDNLVGNSHVAKDYKILEIPQYYLIDEDGIIIYASKNGFEQKMEDMIVKIIEINR